MKISGIIKSFRAKRELRQEDVANMLEISRQTYNSLENDLLNNDCLFLFRLLDILKLSDNESDEFFDVLKQDFKSYSRTESKKRKGDN